MDTGTEEDLLSDVLLAEILGIEDLSLVGLEVLREGEGEDLGVK
jgi:hypothetical protein